MAEWQPEALVVGVPYNVDGSKSESTEMALAFAQRIAAKTGLAVAQIDERLTSYQAREILKTQRESGKRKRKIRRGDIDQLAAKLIAESWLRGT